jgi:glycosyltransferase involved in cell wall biosynthesis
MHMVINLVSNSAPLVSVIIPNYNGEIFLKESLESVLAQSYKNIEIIVIDDGSTDRSVEILEEYQSKIRFIKSSHNGAAVTRNIGIELSSGEYLAFMDSDDIWMSEKIEKQMSIALNDDVDLIYCGYQEFGLSSKIILPNLKFNGDCYSYFKEFPGVSPLGCSGILIRSSILLKSGMFDKRFTGAAEDWDFLRRICMNGRVAFSAEVLYYYRRHENSITGRLVWDYYKGNQMAVVKMLNEDPRIKNLEQHRIWIKLHWMLFKSFAKRKKVIYAAVMLFKALLPIPRMAGD